MQIFRPAALAATLAMLAGPAAAATTFDFFWTGDPSVDSTITNSGDATAGATGTFVIDAGPGDEVRPANVLSFSLIFGTATLGTLEITSANSKFFFLGTVSADGTSIAMRDLIVSTVSESDQFGCGSGPEGACEFFAGRNIFFRRNFGSTNFTYATGDDARASLRFTAQQQAAVIPLPATLPLLLGALGLFAMMRRRAA